MANKPPVMVVDSKSRPWWLASRTIIIAVVVVVIAAAAATYWFWLRKGGNGTTSTNNVSQQLLQKDLQSALTLGDDPQSIVNDASQLIAGQKDGKFSSNKADLSQLYLQRASAYISLQEYQNAISDFKQAAQLDSSNQMAALEGEVEAGYKLGQRQQLIPLYQQLVRLKTNSDDPMRYAAIAQYQQNIQTLQQGGELTF